MECSATSTHRRKDTFQILHKGFHSLFQRYGTVIIRLPQQSQFPGAALGQCFQFSIVFGANALRFLGGNILHLIQRYQHLVQLPACNQKCRHGRFRCRLVLHLSQAGIDLLNTVAVCTMAASAGGKASSAAFPDTEAEAPAAEAEETPPKASDAIPANRTHVTVIPFILEKHRRRSSRNRTSYPLLHDIAMKGSSIRKTGTPLYRERA